MYNNYNFDNSLLVVFWVFILIGAIIGIIIAIFYLLNLQNLLKEIEPENRLVEPGNVWLMLIPIFNLIYPFILYPKICDSVRNEYEARGLDAQGDFGRGIGIAMPILVLCGLVPILGGLAGLANLVLFIIFWVKMAEYKNALRSSQRGVKGFSTNVDILD